MKQKVDVDLNMLIDEAPFVVLDVETTGLYPKDGHRVIDISMIKWQSGEIVDTLLTLVNPGRSISPEAAAVHGITDAALVGAPMFGDIAGAVWEFLQGAVIVAHNAEFDVRFVNWELARSGYKQWNGVMICTLSMARKNQNAKSNKLGDVAFRMGVVPEAQHSAFGDTMTTLRIFQKFLERYSFQTITNLIRAQGGWKTPPQAPEGRTLDQLLGGTP